MDGNIKGLVSAGHEMASELKAECGAVDMRSVVKLISDLATQLEVQLARANALAEDQQRAIESIKQADAAVKLAHEKFSALAAENAVIKSAIPEPRDIEDDNDNMDDVSLAEDFGFNHAIERMRRRIPETPVTDAFLAEIERKAIRKFINSIEHILRDKLSPYDTEEMLEAMRIFLEEQSGEQK
ncbi:ead/Ea22-like family protein [Escherichia coli]|uniref:ead/Ea22-like family protein n=1 Tax=Escherichia coli TaxID=562 RepID=UPI001FF573F5|nr:ead/Ea22-like family protein [Escherichia coli]